MKKIVKSNITKEWIYEPVFESPLIFDSSIPGNLLRIELIVSNVSGELNNSNNEFSIITDDGSDVIPGMCRYLIEMRPDTGTNIFFQRSFLASRTRMDLPTPVSDWFYIPPGFPKDMGTNQVIPTICLYGKCKLLFASMEVKF